MGMASQTAEREDNIIVEDLQGYSFFFVVIALSFPTAILKQASEKKRKKG